MRVKAKIGRVMINVVLLLLTMTVVFIPLVAAKPQYLAALNVVYGSGSCTDCHTDLSGGKSLTDYGSNFKSQSIYKTDSVAALRTIGSPPGSGPAKTSVIVVATPVATAISPVVTDVAPLATEMPTITEAPVIITIPTVTQTGKSKELNEKEEENSEKEETSEKSPGFETAGTIGIIGIVSIIYMLRKYRL